MFSVGLDSSMNTLNQTATSLEAPALVVVDMQRYYLEAESAFSKFYSHLEPGGLDYIRLRCQNIVIPNIARFLCAFRQAKWPVAYLRLCGLAEDRSDLHRTFAQIHREAELFGFPGLYPLRSDPFSKVTPALAPAKGEHQFCKTTYSAFTSAPEFEHFLRRSGRRTLVFTGLATSQCVETTARDAADRDFRVLLVDDAQADYSETSHRASLCSSQSICGPATATANVLEEMVST